MSLNVVLVEPEIPQNTGNIVRTCGSCGAKLHLVKPLGFSVSDKYLKRAGLDYWHLVDIKYYDNFQQLIDMYKNSRFFYCSTKAPAAYDEINYAEGDFLVFGKETAGLPENLLKDNLNNCIRIPMRNDFRSLNLSNAAAIILYEALRQLRFPNMELSGYLKK